MLSLLLVMSCSQHQALSTPPQGDGWRVSNQSYKKKTVTTMSYTSRFGNTRFTHTASQATSSHKFLDGSPIESDENAHCKGRAFIFDCKKIPKADSSVVTKIIVTSMDSITTTKDEIIKSSTIESSNSINNVESSNEK